MKRILVVDDELSFSHLLKLDLEKTEDYEVRVEARADRAFATASEFQPDMILLDLFMPRVSGDRAASQALSDPEFGATPVMFLAAAEGGKWGNPADRLLGGLPLITKPSSPDEIVNVIERRLSVGGGEGTGVHSGRFAAPARASS
jgi:two-component system alkaline phosphatase synthesis response regulator PhoP